MFTGDESVKDGPSRDESLYQNGDSFEDLFGKLQTMKGIFRNFKKNLNNVLLTTVPTPLYFKYLIEQQVFLKKTDHALQCSL